MARLASKSRSKADRFPLVVHSFVEALGEFRGDGLQRNLHVGKHGKDDQQFRRTLRFLGLVHGYLDHEVTGGFVEGNVAMDAPRLCSWQKGISQPFFQGPPLRVPREIRG